MPPRSFRVMAPRGAATPSADTPALSGSNRWQSFGRWIRRSPSRTCRVGELPRVWLAVHAAHAVRRRAIVRRRDPSRVPPVSPASAVRSVGPIIGPNVPDDAGFGRRRGPVSDPQQPTNSGRTGLGGVLSARFTRERSQVRNPPRPLVESPATAGFLLAQQLVGLAVGRPHLAPTAVPVADLDQAAQPHRPSTIARRAQLRLERPVVRPREPIHHALQQRARQLRHDAARASTYARASCNVA
jgi:hypothetical protein